MSGVIILMDRCKSAQAALAIKVEDMFPGDFPLKFTPPALSLRTVGLVEHQPLAGHGAKTMCHERVQLTVAGASNTKSLDLLARVRKAMRNQRGTIAGFENVSVVPLDDGPEFELEGSIHVRSKDFRVSFLEQNS